MRTRRISTTWPFPWAVVGLAALLGAAGHADVIPDLGPVGHGKAKPEPAPPSWFPLYPTVATAGADTCRIDEAQAMGTGSAANALVAFRTREGIVAWRQDEHTVAVRAIASRGSPLGERISIPVAKGAVPGQLFAIERGYLLLLHRWLQETADSTWWGIVLSPKGKPEAAPVDVGLHGRRVFAGQPLGGDQVALLTNPANPEPRPALHWQTLNASSKGGITSSTAKVALDRLVGKLDDSWAMAELDQQRGWVVLRDGTPRPYGAFGGVEQKTTEARPLIPDSAILAEVHNAAVPPPRGPKGTIYEALGMPMLERTHYGKRLEPLFLEWHGSGTGVHGMNVDPHIFWSGTHFLRPFAEDGTLYILPVDCAGR